MTTANKFQDDSFITDSAHDIAEAFDAHEVVEALDRGRLLIPDLARPDFISFGMAVWQVGIMKVETGRRDSIVLTVPGEVEDVEYELTRTRAEDLISSLASALRFLDVLDEEGGAMTELTRHPDMPQHDGLEVLDQGSHRGINWWSCKLTRDSGHHHYTGYVELPESHPLIQLDEINSGEARRHLHPYGGVTFGRGCVVGFDTNHKSADSWRWCASSAREEAIKLADEVARLWSLENQALVSKLGSCLSIWEELREMAKRDGIRLPGLDLFWEPAIEKMHLEEEG